MDYEACLNCSVYIEYCNCGDTQTEEKVYELTLNNIRELIVWFKDDYMITDDDIDGFLNG